MFDHKNAEGDWEQQVSEFVEAPSVGTLLSSSQEEPLDCVQVTQKRVAESKVSVYMVMLYSQEKNISKDATLKFVDREISLWNNWQFYRVIYSWHLMRSMINTNLQLNININNSLLYEARLWNP